MAEALGAGNRITGGGRGVSAYQRIYAFVEPILNPPGGLAPGGVDANGNYLHFLYRGNLTLGPRSGGNQDPSVYDFVPNYIEVEFDAVSCFTLPFEGELWLVGGTGEYKFWIDKQETIDRHFYQPMLRTLATEVEAGNAFIVPHFHTFIMGSNINDTVRTPSGTDLQLSLNLPGAQIMSGTRLTPNMATTIKTGWLG